jgi:2'-5' RNA ligase
MPRLFFALRPQPAERTSIAAALLPIVHALGASPVAEADLHVTLVFLGEVAEQDVPRLQRGIATAASGLVELALTRVDCWEQSRVLCLLPEENAAARVVHPLALSLQAAARAAGAVPHDTPFRPHVTVARKVPPAASRTMAWPRPLPAPLPFMADGFVLMQSTRRDEGRRYDVIHAWPAQRGSE